jgi:hypothetical protein
MFDLNHEANHSPGDCKGLYASSIAKGIRQLQKPTDETLHLKKARESW